jgi:hypothetical protein
MMEENSNDQYRKFFASLYKTEHMCMCTTFDDCVLQRIALPEGYALHAHVY